MEQTYYLTKEQLEQYRSKKAEQKELEDKLRIKKEEDDRALQIYRENLEKIKLECHEMEEHIELIPDSMLRRMLRMRYIDGMSLFLIGNRVHADKSTVSRKINYFLKSGDRNETAATLYKTAR